MKSIVAALFVLSLTTISCTDSDESPQTNKSEIESKSPQTNESEIESKSPQTNESEIESKRRPGSGVDSSITKVTGLVVKVSGPSKIKITWNRVPDATTYWIYRNDYVPAIVPGNTFTDGLIQASPLSPGTSYTYAIAPVVNGVLGPKSVAVTVKTPR